MVDSVTPHVRLSLGVIFSTVKIDVRAKLRLFFILSHSLGRIKAKVLSGEEGSIKSERVSSPLSARIGTELFKCRVYPAQGIKGVLIKLQAGFVVQQKRNNQLQRFGLLSVPFSSDQTFFHCATFADMVA